jgi:hypothetical protein
MTRLLITMEGLEITNGEEKMPLLPTAPAEGAPAAAVITDEAKLKKATGKLINNKSRKNNAAESMYNACSVWARILLRSGRNVDDP